MSEKKMTDSIKSISFYLAKERYSSFEDVLKNTDAKNVNIKYNIDKSFNVDEAECRFIFVQAKNIRQTPKWIKFINSRLDDNDQIKIEGFTQSIKSVLLVKTMGRIVAATFGFGDSLLEKGRFCSDFGIKTAMNLCGNDKVKQTSMVQHKYATQHVSKQASKISEFSEFDMNETDFLNYISAQMTDDIFLQGRDKITLQTKGDEDISWENILDYIYKFIKAYSDDKYKTLFPYYANFEQVLDTDTISELDTILLGYIKSKRINKMHLCIPEFRPDDSYSFVYSKCRAKHQVVSFIDIEDFYKPDRYVFGCSISDLEIDTLKNTNIYAYNHAEDKVLEYDYWKIYDCIIAEIPLKGDVYILSAGIWRKVNSDFITQIYTGLPPEKTVDNKFQNIKIYSDNEYKNREAIYNETIAELSDVIMFDRSKLGIGNKNKIYEFCDLMIVSDNKIETVHVKQNGGSCQVEHLFTQAKVYGESFLYDAVFLNDIRDYINKYEKITEDKKMQVLSTIPQNINDNRGDMYNVGLWILYNKDKPKPLLRDLPLMALYELNHAYNVLKTRNKYKEVYVSFVPVEMAIQKETIISKK